MSILLPPLPKLSTNLDKLVKDTLRQLWEELQRALQATNTGNMEVTYVVGIANLPTTLNTGDTNKLYFVTDYNHLFRWTGSAWTWGPGELGSGYYQFFEDAPAGFGSLAWQLCDGTTVARTNAVGTTTNVTVPNVTTPAYMKAGIISAAIAAASGVSAAVSGGTPAGTNSADSAGIPAGSIGNDNAAAGLITPGAGNNASLSPHQHVFTGSAMGTHTHTFAGSALATHTHGPDSLELRNKQARLYYRR